MLYDTLAEEVPTIQGRKTRGGRQGDMSPPQNLECGDANETRPPRF